MPKTNFVDGDPSQGILGTVVPADFLNAVNKHYHTGLDQDGHGALPYAVDTGTANAYVVNLNPPLTQYINGMPIYFKAANANTGASTVDVNSLGAKTIKKNITQDLAAGDIQAGQIVMMLYDGVNFQLIGGLDAHTVDGYHATAAPTLNAVPVADRPGGKLAWGWMPAAITFYAYRSGAYTVPAGTLAHPFPFESELFDTASLYDTTTYKFTPNVAGYYLFHARVKSATSGGTAYIGISIYKNSTLASKGDEDPSQYTLAPEVTTILYANGTTDYFAVGVSTTISSHTINQGSAYTYFTAHYIGP